MHKHRMGRLSAVRKNNAGPKITKKRPVGRFLLLLFSTGFKVGGLLI